MDFGLATEFYPDEFGYQADVHYHPAPQPDLFNLIQKLHASLDPRTVFACYGQMLGQYLPVQGIQINLRQHKFHWGKRVGISFKRTLNHDNEVAQVHYRLTAPLTPSLLQLLNELEPLLLQPLYNAVKYLDMSQQAMFDALTGLGNRHYYGQSVNTQTARCLRNHDAMSLIVLDLDNFKQLNDKFGHKFGDNVLSEFGKLMNAAIRNSDQAFRIGGDEFVILAQGPAEAAAILCQRILAAMATHPLLTQFNVQTSIGVAEFHHSLDAEHWYEAADKALYQAKASGRNGYRIAEQLHAIHPDSHVRQAS